jgi:hypothetical protein
MLKDGLGLTYTDMRRYNVFQMNRMPADEMQANVVYIFEGKVYQDRFL